MALVIKIQDGTKQIFCVGAERQGDTKTGWNTYRIVDSNGQDYGMINHKYEDGAINLAYQMMCHLNIKGVRICEAGCGMAFATKYMADRTKAAIKEHEEHVG